MGNKKRTSLSYFGATNWLLASVFLLLSTGCRPEPLPDNRPIPSHPLVRYHKVYNFGKSWRLTAKGVEIRGKGFYRTGGKPLTAARIWEDFYPAINRWSAYYRVPAELIVSTIAVEGQVKDRFSRNPRSVRKESGYVNDWKTPGRISVGLTQITLATARAVLEKEGVVPNSVTVEWLMDVDNNIRAGTAFIANQGRGTMSNRATLLDPPVAFAAYNSGGVYHMRGRKNSWKLKQYPLRTGEHVDKAVAWFNDAVVALRGHKKRARYDYHDYLATLDDWNW